MVGKLGKGGGGRARGYGGGGVPGGGGAVEGEVDGLGGDLPLCLCVVEEGVCVCVSMWSLYMWR